MRKSVIWASWRRARGVQQLLLPPKASRTPGFIIDSVYLPAQEVGGDFFQVLPGENGSLLIVVGDVSGKGLSAAMTVSTVIGALRDRKEQAPAAVLVHLNRVLCGQVSGFVTCCVVLADAEGNLTIANAGHLAPYHNGCELPIEGGLPLGLSGDVVYTEQYLRWSPGDRLALISDGVIEAANKRGQLFGFERALAISGEPAATIAQSAKEFGQQDDITVLTVSYQGHALSD